MNISSRIYRHLKSGKTNRGRLRGDIICDSVDALHFVGDAARDFAENIRREDIPKGAINKVVEQCNELRILPVCGHEVFRLHRTERDDLLVRPLVAHYTDSLNR